MVARLVGVLQQTNTFAGIEMHWCTCLNWESAMDDEEQWNVSTTLAKAVVQTINSYTRPERHLCAPLKLVC
ncbi:unnamed protein product [Gongylonema pulchrum]|uniref:IMD domain-containing protein n=1 Tax=Gongylonema pulchrum TaxID=637853 RepID=A0A183E2Z3_9BILA|nr:unnamed protein product [Gongylonema pulchrum]